jgi:hypothetical protein
MENRGLTENATVADPACRPGCRGSGWFRLFAGLGAVWILAYVLLPWVSGLAAVRPVMEVLEEAGGDATAYFYTQSEQTALAQMHVRNVLAAARGGPRH